MFLKSSAIIIVTLLAAAFFISCGREATETLASGPAPDWIRWRGPGGNGIYPETQWNPASLKDEVKPIWTIQVGKGYSSVVINGDLLYTLGYDNGKDTVFCFNINKTKLVWSYSYKCTAGEWPGPKATPYIDGDVLYTLSQEGHLFCFNALNGEIIWQKKLSDFGALAPTWGFAGSPLVIGDLLLLNACQAGLALNKKTGEVVWKSASAATGYSTPVVYTQNDTQYIALFAQKNACGVELETGKLAWAIPWETSYDVNAADPLIFDQKIFISTNYRKGSLLADISGSAPKEIWKYRDILSSHFSSFIYYKGYIYGVDGSSGGTPGSFGAFQCIDAQTGELKWGVNANLGSLIMIGEKLIYLKDQGGLIVAQASPDEYHEITTAKLTYGLYWTPPVFCKGKLYIRNNTLGEYYCIDVR
jgi:outer membrane protein assembly factor BamB